MTAIEKCRSLTKVTKVKVEENGRKATFLNEGKQEFFRTKIDGCLMRNQLAADWIVTKKGVGDIIVELKGSDVEHGTDQVIATGNAWIRLDLRVGRMSGLIVATRFPRFDTAVRKAKEKFAKKFGGPLHVVLRNCEFEFEKVLDFGGPL